MAQPIGEFLCPNPECVKVVNINPDGKLWHHQKRHIEPGTDYMCPTGGMTPAEARSRFPNSHKS